LITKIRFWNASNGLFSNKKKKNSFFYSIRIFVKRTDHRYASVIFLAVFSRLHRGDGVVGIMKNRQSRQSSLLLLLFSYSLKRQSPGAARSFKCIANTSSELLGKLRASESVGEIFTRPEHAARKGCFQ